MSAGAAGGAAAAAAGACRALGVLEANLTVGFLASAGCVAARLGDAHIALAVQTLADLDPLSIADARERAERNAIEMALLRNGGRLGDAARELGVSRVTLYRLLGSYGFQTEGVETGTGD